jgi:Rrf2 family nitric oxide-sensitive transcriptional repressor
VELTNFSDYCLRVLIFVAAHPDQRATIAEIARSYGISENHLVKVVHFLGKAGLLANERGRNGGVRLAQPAATIRVGDVVRLTEGTGGPVACFDADAPRCRIAPVCKLRGMLGDAVTAFYAVLAQYTLADLVAEPAPLRRILLTPARAAPARRTGGARARAAGQARRP